MFRFVQNEPVLYTYLLTGAAALAAQFGFHLSPDQIAKALAALVVFLAPIVRQQVTPVNKAVKGAP